MRPRSGTAVPARICIKVDLPAPLCPTRPRHSPHSTRRSTPPSARTAPKCFSTPSSSTIVGLATIIARTPGVSEPLSVSTKPLLHVGFDGDDGFLLGIFVACDATLGDVGQFSLEIVLGEGEVRHQQVMRYVLVAVKHLLSNPEGKCRNARSDRGRPTGVAVLRLLLLPPLKFILAIAHDNGRPRLVGGGERLGRSITIAALI